MRNQSLPGFHENFWCEEHRGKRGENLHDCCEYSKRVVGADLQYRLGPLKKKIGKGGGGE